jgi:hypothetical protein
MSALVIRLITGEELLGGKISECDDTIVIENVVVVHQAPSQNNPESTTIYLSPFAPLADSKKFTIRKSSMVCSYEPIVELLNKYNSLFGSGIIIPKTLA